MREAYRAKVFLNVKLAGGEGEACRMGEKCDAARGGTKVLANFNFILRTVGLLLSRQAGISVYFLDGRTPAIKSGKDQTWLSLSASHELGRRESLCLII